MFFKHKIIILMIIFSLISSVRGQNCVYGIEVELWNWCYNVWETTVLDPPFLDTNGQVIPPEIGQLTNLTELNLNGKGLIGEIPSEIGNLTNLTYLNLNYNQLTGQIPSEIGSLVNLIILQLNKNNLSGQIPENICDLTIDWAGIWLEYDHVLIPYFYVDENNLCPYYPECLTEDNIGVQDTSECGVGDLNFDSSVNIFDIIILAECLLSNDCFSYSDINYDGEVNIIDIISLVNIILYI